MRFAVVRNNTPSGEPWKPTAERPNYLCDESEIDSVGTATWVTALDGELLPYPWIRDGTGVSPHAGLLSRAIHRLGRLGKGEAFSRVEEFRRFDVVLVVQHANAKLRMGELVRQAKRAAPQTIFIGRPGNSLEHLRRFWSTAEGFACYADFARECHLHLTQNLGTESYFETIFGTPTHYLPPFYPYDFVRGFYKRKNQKEKIILIASEPQRDDWTWSGALARTLQKKYPDYRVQVSTWASDRQVTTSVLEGSRYEILPAEPWKEFLKRIANAMLVLNTDTIWTCGRLCEDSASVGTPCLGVNADMQRMLFPDLTIPEMFGTELALELAERLLSDEHLYNSIQERAFQRAENLSYARSAERLKDLVAKYKFGRMPEWLPWNPNAVLESEPVLMKP